MPSRVKNFKTSAYLIVLLTTTSALLSCSTTSTQKERHLSGREILDKMFLEFVYNQEFEELYSTAEKDQNSPTAYVPPSIQSITLSNPIEISISLQPPEQEPLQGISVDLTGHIPSTVRTKHNKLTLLLYSSAKGLKGRYGVISTTLTPKSIHSNEQNRIQGSAKITRKYNDTPVEFIDPSIVALYSKPFSLTVEGKSHPYIFAGLHFTAAHQANPQRRLYRCDTLELIPYSQEGITPLIQQTQPKDALYRVAQRLLKDLKKSVKEK